MARTKGTKKYGVTDVIGSLRVFGQEHGRAPTWTEWDHGKYKPSRTTMVAVCGSWSNALVLAGFEPLGYESYRKWDENEDALHRLRAGETLTAIAMDIGVTPQALGRRLRRHVKAVQSDPVPLRSRRGRRSGGLWANAA